MVPLGPILDGRHLPSPLAAARAAAGPAPPKGTVVTISRCSPSRPGGRRCRTGRARRGWRWTVPGRRSRDRPHGGWRGPGPTGRPLLASASGSHPSCQAVISRRMSQARSAVRVTPRFRCGARSPPPPAARCGTPSRHSGRGRIRRTCASPMPVPSSRDRKMIRWPDFTGGVWVATLMPAIRTRLVLTAVQQVGGPGDPQRCPAGCRRR